LTLIVAVIVAMVGMWLVAEVRRWPTVVRIGTGVLAMVAVCFFVWLFCVIGTTFSYNAWYGFASRQLIRASILAIEKGRTEQVLEMWRELDQKFQPTYENRGRYDEWVEEAVKRIEESAPSTRAAP